ncbi:hypothetical protein AB4Z38_25150 [Arthrobacter sp. 2RAF6]|uniref:hypothetical protein n=1 Tax=Arthrobacter sp. 2RAF6 TaxID=3233002 RepID=UPI003F90868D
MAYIRYPDSPAGSLSSIWNQGIATPSAGSIYFQPAVYDTLEPSGRPTTIKVTDLLQDRRKDSGKDRRYIQFYGIQAMTLLTEDGKVEIAAPPESLDKLAEALGPLRPIVFNPQLPVGPQPGLHHSPVDTRSSTRREKKYRPSAEQ